MKLNLQLPLNDRNQARIAAQAIVRSGFNPKLAIAELRPDIKCYGPFFAKLMEEPAIQQEIEKIMSRTERNAQKFLAMHWEIFEKYHAKVMSSEKVEKDLLESGQTSARLLAKGYISDKSDSPPLTSQLPADSPEADILVGKRKDVM